MKKNNTILEKFRIKHPLGGIGIGNNGCFIVPYKRKGITIKLRVISSDQLGWDHISVSTGNRIPTWGEMCFIKELFFKEEETVVQIHPPKTIYVNTCNNCLHLWRNQKEAYKLPPLNMV